MTAILLFLRKVPLWVWVALALLAAGLFYGHLRFNAGEASGKAVVQKKFDAHLAADKEATDKANAAYRAKEQKDRDRLAEIGFQYERDKMAAKDEADRVIAGLRNDSLRLRDRFRGSCPNVSQAPGSPGIGAGQADAGFNEADAGVAFGIARDGDQAIVQLSACQTILEAERE